LGSGNSRIVAVCDRFVATDVRVQSFTDFTTLSLNITNATITHFISMIGGNKFIKSGIFETLLTSQGNYQLNLDQAQVANLTIEAGNVAVVQAVTTINNFNFFGGFIWQQDKSGIFKVTNTTYLGTSALKSLQIATTLVTDYLDCRQCLTQDCALALSDWNRIQYTKSSSGCLV